MPPAKRANVLAVVGPTASGKSRLGMEIATHVGGEIIGADSRQIYRHMDIGTAKPTLDDREQVPHHLVDIIDPSDEYSVALYVRQAREAISGVLERGAVPIVVGGTGQYVWALLEGWNVPEVSPDRSLRAGTPGTPRPKRTGRPRSRASQDRSPLPPTASTRPTPAGSSGPSNSRARPRTANPPRPHALRPVSGRP